LARYDNESNGSYLVRGMGVTCLSSSDTEQVFTINDGKAHVNGYEIELEHSLRVRFDNEIDLQTVNSDPYLFEGDFENKMTIHLNHTPLASVISVDATVQKTANITHGSYNGAPDPLPATSINDANASDPSTKKGIFVDPFFDDDMRDQGIEQTGAIVDQCLMLPIRAEVHDLAKDQKVYMLPYDLEPVISQELQSGSMKVNPYMAFDPIPADVNVTLNIDHWTEVETQWLSAVTQYVSRGYSSSVNSLVSSTSKNAEFMRQLTQRIRIEGLKPGEVISEIKFDGTGVTLDPIV
jgi:hypothetical protein